MPEVLEADRESRAAAEGRSPNNRLQALIFDSWFDAYRGVVVLARVFQGTLRKGQRIRLMVERHDLRRRRLSACSRPSRWRSTN